MLTDKDLQEALPIEKLAALDWKKEYLRGSYKYWYTADVGGYRIKVHSREVAGFFSVKTAYEIRVTSVIGSLDGGADVRHTGSFARRVWQVAETQVALRKERKKKVRLAAVTNKLEEL